MPFIYSHRRLFLRLADHQTRLSDDPHVDATP